MIHALVYRGERQRGGESGERELEQQNRIESPEILT